MDIDDMSYEVHIFFSLTMFTEAHIHIYIQKIYQIYFVQNVGIFFGGFCDQLEYVMLQELLALGERIGTVSTGLSDGALSECLKRSIYVPTTSTIHEDGDLKCIICQVCSYTVTA